MAKKVFFLLIIILVAIQFFRPALNQSKQVYPDDIARIYTIPEKVQGVLRTSCYDCHSNNTKYPWYANIQPMGWWLASHIKKGKEELNFNEFGDYSRRRQQSKLKAIASSIEDATMPLESYTLIHKKAKLSAHDKDLVIKWVEKTKDMLSKKK